VKLGFSAVIVAWWETGVRVSRPAIAKQIKNLEIPFAFK